MDVVAQPRLLVVDDEEAICEGCRRILTRQGFAVEKTSDPVEGLDRATNADYAAILLDIKMPAMTGLDFLSQLRSRRQDIPVILMTGFPSVPTAVSAISLAPRDTSPSRSRRKRSRKPCIDLRFKVGRPQWKAHRRLVRCRASRIRFLVRPLVSGTNPGCVRRPTPNIERAPYWPV